MADSRSWSSMMSLFRDLTAISDNTPTMTDANDGEAMVVDGTDSSSESSSGKNDDEAMGVEGTDSSESSSGKILLHGISTVVVAAAAATMLL